MDASQSNATGNNDLPKEETSRDRNGDLGSPPRSRRTLLKGMAAVPVIMTLPSGAAAAMSSSRCLATDRQRAAEIEPAWITGSSKDTWVRKAVTARTIAREGIDPSNVNSFQAVARDGHETIQMNGNGGANEPFVVYQLDPGEDVWLDRKGREGRHYYTIQGGIQGDQSGMQGESTLAQTGSQTETTQTVSSRTFIERYQALERSSSIQLWKGGWWKETGVSTTESGVSAAETETGKKKDNSPLGTTDRPIRKMKDGLGNTYSIVTGDTAQYIIAQVDEQGRIVGFGSTPQFNHITGSCWSSINPLTDMI